MSFTSRYIHNGARSNQVRSNRFSAFSMYEKNWQQASICTDQVGNPMVACAVPGNGNSGKPCCSNSQTALSAQNVSTMKNARKQLGEVAGMDATQLNPVPVDNAPTDTFPVFEDAVFFKKPQPRQPESPDTESFRSWLKSNAHRHSASPALLERIRTIPEDHKA